MKLRHMAMLAAVSSAWSLAAYADRDTGWEFGGELIYQDSTEFNSDENSSASLDSDLGFALTFGYRFSSKLEFTFGIDWNNIDYKAHVVSADFPGLSADIDGELEAWTPRVGANFNFLEGPLTPYVTAAVGWSFIDTNIPDSPPQTACWWDPWWGYYCGTTVPTKNETDLSYLAAAGLRWDAERTFFLRGFVARQWVQVGGEVGAVGTTQYRIDIGFRF